jgi:hypothetical protein
MRVSNAHKLVLNEGIFGNEASVERKEAAGLGSCVAQCQPALHGQPSKARALSNSDSDAGRMTKLSSSRFSNCARTTAQQVDDQNHERHDQQQMDQASSHVQAETQKPQN